MDTVARRILELFDELCRSTLDLHAFCELAGGARPESREAALSAAAWLTEQGFLRVSGSDMYARTEDGRLAVAAPLDVTLYTRAGCHLCEEVEQQIAPLIAEFGARLREVDIDADALLRERYTDDVPVIFLGARKVAKHRVDLAQFRRQLVRAREGR